jgi:hypothetical protein
MIMELMNRDIHAQHVKTHSTGTLMNDSVFLATTRLRTVPSVQPSEIKQYVQSVEEVQISLNNSCLKKMENLVLKRLLTA